MGLSAEEFGRRYVSCIMQERAEFDRLYPGKGQAGFYTSCQNGEYLIWQLRQLPWKVLSLYRLQLAEIARRAANRACGYVAAADTSADIPTAVKYLTDAKRAANRAADLATKTADAFLNTDRATSFAVAAAGNSIDVCNVAACAEARQKELQMQADDVHELIPVWPGE